MIRRKDIELIRKGFHRHKPLIFLNENKPYFNKGEIRRGKKGKFEEYSPLSESKICKMAFACIVGKTLKNGKKPKHKSKITPTAWKSIECDAIKDGKYLYNRCHLIARQFSAKKVGNEGIITGTRRFNFEGMFKYEEKVAHYINKYPDHHVLYRVTPYFEKGNHLAYGVQIEILAIENRKEFFHNVFVYNRQSEFNIDYRNGDVYSDYPLYKLGRKTKYDIYILDNKAKKFHKECCLDVCDISSKVYFAGNSENLLYKYSKCDMCIH